MNIDRRQLLAGMAATPLAASLPFEQVTVFEARKIVTMERSWPQARFMAVADGIVLGLARSLQELEPWTSGRQVTLERRFADQVLFPGLIDPHIHPMQSAVMLNVPFIAPEDWHLPAGRFPAARGEEDYHSRLAKLARESTSDPLITWGHHELFHGKLDRAKLDQTVPDRPLIVWQRSFHDIYTNTAALEWMGLADEAAFQAAVEASHADPAHASFERGVFSETALGIAIAKLQPILLAPAALANGFAGLQQMMHSRGVTTTSDLATGIFDKFEREAGIIANFFAGPDSTARINLMPIGASMAQIEDLSAWHRDSQAKFASDKVLLKRRVKLFADGAFFAQNMRMGAPGYSDGHIGKWLTEPADLAGQMKRFWEAGFAVHIHANGDEGVAATLDAVRGLAPRFGQDIVLEHLGYCTDAQVRQIAAMGLKVSAQPNYIRVLGEAYGRVGFGPDRAALMNRLGSLERAHVPLGLHSDFNMAPIDPFYLAWIAQTREGLDGIRRAPNERLSREKALRAITLEAAQVIGMDAMVGSLAAGKKADFIALDHDPFEVDVDAMKDMPIAATVFEGRLA